MGSVIGSWAFLVGVVLAIVLGALGDISETLAIVLLVLGLLIGLLNVTEKETQRFLAAGAVLVFLSWASRDVLSIVPVVARIFDANLLIFVPATAVVALKSVFRLAKN